jgi:hypothetical protein
MLLLTKVQVDAGQKGKGSKSEQFFEARCSKFGFMKN